MSRRILLVLLALVLPACGSVQAYPGGARSDAQVAQILPENAFNRQRQSGLLTPACGTGEVRVRICGKSLGGFSNRFEVLPGRVDLQVGYLNDETPFPDKLLRTRAVALSLDAVAGHTYGIRGQATWVGNQVQVRIWAVDSADGRRVASVDVPAANVFFDDGEPRVGVLSD